MEKKRILIVGLIGLLLAIGLALVGCKEECPGNGQCTVFIGNSSNGPYVDEEKPHITCGRGYETSNSGNKTAGCAVDDNINNYNRKSGQHGCSCD